MLSFIYSYIYVLTPFFKLEFRKRDELLAPDRMRAIQKELAAFFLDHVIAENGEYYVDPVFLQFN